MLIEYKHPFFRWGNVSFAVSSETTIGLIVYATDGIYSCNPNLFKNGDTVEEIVFVGNDPYLLMAWAERYLPYEQMKEFLAMLDITFPPPHVLYPELGDDYVVVEYCRVCGSVTDGQRTCDKHRDYLSDPVPADKDMPF